MILDWARARYADGSLSQGALEEVIAAALAHPLPTRATPPGKPWWPVILLCVFMCLFPLCWHMAALLTMLGNPHDSVAGVIAVQMCLLIPDGIVGYMCVFELQHHR